MTAAALVEERDACKAAGMDDYVAKPITPEKLIAALGRIPCRPDRPEGPPEAPREPEALEPSVEAALSDLRDTLGDATASEIVGLFLKGTPRLVSEMRAALSADDADTVTDRAHQLKSMSLTVGAEKLGAACARLEAAGRAAELSRGPAMLAAIEALVDALLPALQKPSGRA
jgi:HPt (histidine-containing phosphotransfer) domain-containing protein